MGNMDLETYTAEDILNLIKLNREELRDKTREYLEDLYFKINDVQLKYFYNTFVQMRDRNFGYVYFLYNEDTKLIKIGQTMDLEKRLKTIKSIFQNTIGISPKFKIVKLIVTHKTLLGKVEKDYHNLFRENRRFGEWFNIDENDVINLAVLGDFETVQDTLIVTDDSNEFHLYGDIKRDYTISDRDVDCLLKKRTPFESYMRYESNKLLEAINYIRQNKISVKIETGEKETIIGYDNEFISINKIKSDWFSENRCKIEKIISHL